MILAFDTYYYDHKAKTVCVAFDGWVDKEPVHIYTEILDKVAEYQSGEFYKRELPCIMSLLKSIDLQLVKIIIVDSFVVLDDAGSLGLGGHLFNQLNQTIPIIGVAKNNFFTLQQQKRTLLRGDSQKPLYITSVGIDLDIATAHIQSMHGPYRIPTLLKQLDGLTKEGEK